MYIFTYTCNNRLALFCDKGNFSATHSYWWDRANTSYMEHVMYFALKYLSSILHVSNILILQNFMVDKLMTEDTDSVCEI